ncbi:MAG: IPT/TIG domain-containing protein, partial [Chloroflexi bacterium]|nr:IPT/TIG domain-containing protein [Chloroflexota bacterium]
PMTVGPGTSVELATFGSGCNFDAGETITFTFDGQPITTIPSTVIADGCGNFSRVLFRVPANATAGAHTVGATGANSGATATATVTVATTFITLDPVTGGDAQPVTVTGAGFDPAEDVTIRFNTSVMGTVAASGTGTVSATFRVPNVNLNSAHTVSATGSVSGKAANARFVVPGTTIRTLGTFAGGPGTSVGLEGFGFASGELITFTFNGAPLTTVPASVRSDQCCWGFRNVLFTIPPETAPGTYQIEARGGSSGARAAFPIEVVETFIALNPPQGGSSLPIAIAGQGFSGSESVTVRFDGNVVATLTADSAGAFTGAFRVPSVSVNSTHSVTATGDVSGKSASAFFLAPATFFNVSPLRGGPGTSVGVSGVGFGGDEAVAFTFDGAPLPTVPQTVTTDCCGNFGRLWLFRVPEGTAAGMHTIRAAGLNTGRVAEFPFEVVSSFIRLDPMRGWENLPVTVNGVGFQAGEAVSFQFDGNTVGTLPATVTVQADGTFTARFTTGGLGLNTFHTVSATGSASTKTASAGFVVPSPALVLSPTSAPAGATVTITRSFNWASNEPLRFTFDGALLATEPATVTANVCCWGFNNVTFLVPPETAPGTHQLEVTGLSSGARATFAFLVTPSGVTTAIALTPSTGPAGSQVTVTGTNFSLVDTTATITFDGASVPTTPSTVAVTDGALSASFVVPTGAAPGNHTVCVTGNPAGDRSCALYTVVAGFITLSPPSGPPGATVTVSGGNFLPADTSATLTFDGVAIATTPSVITVSGGSFTASFRIPQGTTAGSHIVRVVGSPGDDAATALFNVTQEGAVPVFTGKVNLEALGAAGDPRRQGYPLRVTLFPSGGVEPLAPVFATADPTGHFTVVASIPSGPYDIEVKGHHTLSNKRLGVVLPQTAGAAPLDFGTLTSGDLTNDNAVLGGDYSILVTNYGQSGPRIVSPPQARLQAQQAVPVAEAVHLALRPAAEVVRVGQVFRVEVVASAVQGGVDSVDLFLEFDPATLQLVDETGAPATALTAGLHLPVALRSVLDHERGRLALSAGRAPLAPPPGGTFTVATLFFKALAASPEAHLALGLSAAAPTTVHYQGRSVLGSVSYGSLAILEETSGSGESAHEQGTDHPAPWAGDGLVALDVPRREAGFLNDVALPWRIERGLDPALLGHWATYLGYLWQQFTALLRV